MSGYRVFIGRLNHRSTKMDIERFFKGFGRIRDIDLRTGYGIVDFEDPRDADDAVYKMNNKILHGSRIIVAHKIKDVPRNRGSARVRVRGGAGGSGEGGRENCDVISGGREGRNRFDQRSRTKYRLIVENIASRAGCQDLKDLFCPVGEVTFADAHQYIQSQGVVDFATYSELNNAIEKLDNYELMGRKIRLFEEKSHSRSRSRSRSSNRSTSRSRPRSAKRRSRSPRRRSRSDSVENGNDRDGSKSTSLLEDCARLVRKSPERE